MAESELIRLLIAFSILLYSVILHEISHAVTDYALGDPTAKNAGRISLNPLRHIDLFNTIILPIICYLTLGFPFGGAKPVVGNNLNFKNPDLGFALSCLAGPVCNILLAIFGFAILFGIYSISPDLVHSQSYNAFFFKQMILINLILAGFNLLPVPPLDGSRVVRFFMPSSIKIFMDSVERFGLFIVIFLITTGKSDIIISLFGNIMYFFMTKMFGIDYTNALLYG